VVKVVNATMEKAIRLVSIEKGHDPREFSLVAFGGAGGLHACELAESLSIPQVIIPLMPGALSAIGILMSDVAKDYSRTVMLRAAGKLPLRDLGSEAKSPMIDASLDLRYRGQGFELNVPFGRDALKIFHSEHLRRYGYQKVEDEVEVVTVRLRATVRSPKINLPSTKNSGSKDVEPRSMQSQNRRTRARTFWRDKIPTTGISGPAVICEYSATTMVPKGWRARVDRAGNLVLRPGR
jgi:N-methylhydantoinase A